MRLANIFRLRLRSLLSRKKIEQELDEELRYHLERQIDAGLAAGMTREQARYAALQSIKDLEQRKEECRDMRKVHIIETLFHDVRYGLRTLRKSPGFTSAALLTLALGIGATTAIFSVVYAVLLRPLPYKDPSRLIVLNETTPKVGTVSVSYLNFLDWRAQSRAFSEMAAVHGGGFNLAGITQPENISGLAVSSNFLSMLGVHPFLGRAFDPSEEKAGTAPVVLLSYSLWQSHFGGDRSVIGRVITLDGRGFTVVGVLPSDFRWIEKTDVLEPIGVWAGNDPDSRARGARGEMVAVGRLRPGMTFEQARAEMEAIAARLARQFPAANDQFGVALRPVREIFVSEIRPAILVAWGAAIFVLLIACANVANLFLVRGAGRTKEIALRMAIGASRSRIICQTLAESFLLAFLGGILGLALAFGGIRGISKLIPVDSLAGASVNLNSPVLLFAAAVAVLSALIFGIAPAIDATRTDAHSELKEGGRTTTSSAKKNRWRGGLVVTEIALALILLTGAGLMMKSLYRLLSVDPGFRPDRVLTMEMSLRTSQYYKDAAILNFWQQVLDRVRVLPGVESAALGTLIPMTNDHDRGDITIEGMALPKPGSFPHPDIHIVSTGYVTTLGVELLSGRAFTDADNDNAPRVAMINAMVAEHFFRNENPLGKRFMFGRLSENKAPRWITIVGVVGDTKLYGLANPARLEVYVPFRQGPSGYMNLIVKTRTDPGALTSAIRRVIASIDKDQPVFGIATMNQLVADSVSTQRMTLILLGLFSALALVLATIGIYGVISYSLAERTHEIGIRIALGAQPTDVLRMILAQGARTVAIGVIIGIVASLGLTRLMTKLLFSVSPLDPATFAAVAIVLALIAMLACYIPARRVLSVDPMVALRYE
ncbi:MAG: ABC transporter permease [Bryobacteraceae bacterium]